MPKPDCEISATVANALVTGSPLSDAQLEGAYLHFKQLADQLSVSGPKFSDARESAVLLGNAALTRLRDQRARAEAERKAREHDDGLEVIR